MSTFKARIYGQQLLTVAPQTSVDGGVPQRLGYGTTTSNGAADGTTIIDADGTANSGSADTYNGRYWVELLSGSYIHEWKRVVDDDGAGTLTLEGVGFSGQVVSGVEYALWEMPESNIAVVDSSGDETDMVDARRDEDSDFWIGYWAVPITGNRKGRIAQVTDFTTGTGTFVLASGLGGALAAGDVVMLVRPLEVGEFQPGFSTEFLSRLTNRSNFSKGDGVIGAKGPGPLNFTTDVYGSGSLPGEGVAATRSPLAALFQASGYEETLGETTLSDDGGGANTTTSIKIDTATHENFKIGQVIVHAGNLTRITDKTDGAGSADTLTVSPPLPTVPNDDDPIYGTSMYEAITTGDYYGCNIVWEVDGVRHTFFGCKGSAEFMVGPKLALKWTFQYDHYIRELETHVALDYMGSAYPSQRPVLGKDAMCYLTTSQVDCNGFTASAGTSVAPRNVSGRYGVNGRAGAQMTGRNPGGSFRSIVESDATSLAAEILWNARTSKALFFYYGSHGNAFCVSAPVARITAEPSPESLEGFMAVPYQWEAHDAGVFVDPTDDVVKVPDFAFHIT